MAKLTIAKAAALVDGGSILRRLVDGVYKMHKFSGNLEGYYYECATPTTHDLGLDETTSKADAIAAFKVHFKTIENKGTAPVIDDSNDW